MNKTFWYPLLCFFALGIYSTTSAQISNEATAISDDIETVLGDSIVPEGTYPWMTTLILDDGSQGCGASLIHPEWVLTAAHCHIDFAGQPQIDKVLINSLTSDINNIASYSEFIEVDEIIVHEDFGGIIAGGFGPDIALLHLSNPSVLPTIDLATDNDVLYYSHGMPAKVLGWGKTQTGGNLVDSLLLSNCVYMAHDTCANLYSNSTASPTFYDLNVGGNICAGFFSGNSEVGAAQGDSGGPLFYEIGSIIKQVGIVSGGNSDITTEDFPGVYTLIPNYIDWIDSVITNYPSGSASLEHNTRDELEISVLNGHIFQLSNLHPTGNYLFKIIDNLGRIVSEHSCSGVKTKQVNLDFTSKGIYTVLLEDQTNGYKRTKRFSHF